MHRIITSAGFILLAVSSLFAQSQRLVLIEEFTQASCPACATANPGFNTLLSNNSEKVIPLKYQVWWPGTDPMYNQNPADVNTRVAFYSVTGVPNAVMDGNVFQGYPLNISQSMINTEYAVPASFYMNLSHELNSSLDTVYISIIITASESISGNLKLFTVLTENRILFNTPPGSNNETDFRQVMRKMIPDAQGTDIPDSWASGQSQTFYFAVPVPEYYYNLSQLAVVAFVQDVSVKNVKQAVFDPPQLLNNDTLLDAGISALSDLEMINCSMPVNVTATLKNYGTTALTSAVISYQIDTGPWTETLWNGFLPANATTLVNISDIITEPGIHIIKIRAGQPNGSADLYPYNNSRFNTMMYVTEGIPGELNEGYQPATFPPVNWMIHDITNNGKTWTRTTLCGGFGQSSASVRIPFYSMSTVGEKDEMILPPLDLSQAVGALCVFNVAYAQYNSSYVDKLRVLASTDCGYSWNVLYQKQANTLATAPPTTSSFVPGSSQWRTDTVDLSAYAGISEVLVKFEAENGYGNNLYLDDIKIDHLLCKIQGTLQYLNSQLTPLGNTCIGLYHDNQLIQSDIANSSGIFEFNEILPGNYQIKPQINLPWGGGNSIDALKILKHFTGMIPLTGLYAVAANTDGNSIINATDALWVSKRFVGLVNSAPVGDWVTEKPWVSVSGLIPVIVPIKALCTGDVDGNYLP